MIEKSVAFIGGGRITRTFLGGWASALKSKRKPLRSMLSLPPWIRLISDFRRKGWPNLEKLLELPRMSRGELFFG